MKPVQEILGAVNYWLNAKGEAHTVGVHAIWACQNVLKIRVPRTLVMEPIYKKMYSLGWARVAIDQGVISVDYERLTADQLFWLQQEANKRNMDVLDDQNHVIITPQETTAESVVDQLLA